MNRETWITRGRRLLRAWIWVLAGVAIIAAAAAFFPLVEVNIRGDYHGIYLLDGVKKRFELTDDLYLDEPPRVLFGISFELVSRLHRFVRHRRLPLPHLFYDWNSHNGTGYVENHLDATRTILTCFSRFEDAGGLVTSGLFVGGGLPYSKRDEPALNQNSTGMAYYNGSHWHHLWCTVNESLTSAKQVENVSYPSSWRFLGTEILRDTPVELAIASRHEMAVDGVPLHMDRYAFFRAGDPYFILVVKVRNMGRTPAAYFYDYGDEPWVGNYGTCRGNIGWVKDGFVFREGFVDTSLNSFAGMYDIGNPLIHEGEGFTETADFIEWLGTPRPDQVFFSNSTHRVSVGEPLRSLFERSLFLQWGPRTLQPGQAETYTMAIGMAAGGRGHQVPVKPETRLTPDQLALVK